MNGNGYGNYLDNESEPKMKREKKGLLKHKR